MNIPKFPLQRYFFQLGSSISLVLLCTVLSCLPVVYGANDDIGIVGVLSGCDGFPPDNYVSLLSQTFSSFLYFLYQVIPGVPWYGLTLFFISWLGVSLTTSVLVRIFSGNVLSMAISLPALFFFVMYCYSFMTYTTASLLLAFGVLLAALEWQMKGMPPVRHARSYAVFLSVCMLVSFLLRWGTIPLFFVFSAPIIFFLKKRHVKTYLLVISAVLLLCLVDRVLFHKYVSTPVHEEYQNLEILRKVFHDTAMGDYHGDITLTALKTTGWTIDDYLFFKNGNFYDNSLFNKHALEIFLEQNSSLLTPFVSGINTGRFWGEFEIGKNFALIFVLTIVPLIMLNFNNYRLQSGRYRLKAGMIYVFLSVPTVVLFFVRFRLHVFIPLFIYLMAVCLLTGSRQEITSSTNTGEDSPAVSRYGLLITSVAIIFLLAAVKMCYAQEKIILEYLDYSYKEKKMIKDSFLPFYKIRKQVRAPFLFVLLTPLTSSDLGVEKIHPLKEYADFVPFSVFPGGWQINSPRFFAILRQIGLEKGRDFLGWSTGRPDVLFVFFARDENFHQQIVYLWESYINRHISPDSQLRLTIAYDFRGQSKEGLVFYRWAKAD